MHETKDLNVRGVVRFGVALTAVAIVLHLAIAGLYAAFRRNAERSDRPRHPLAVTAPPPAPRLEVAPRAAREALRREEDDLLRSYGWVDRAQGRARIPLTRAFDLIEKKGLPVRTTTPPAH